MLFEKEKQQICEMGRRIWQRGWTACNGGNISVRIDEHTFIMTPTGVSKGFMTPEMMLVVDENGNKLEQNDRWSMTSEFRLHMMCYNNREDIRSVIHAHTPMCTVFAAARRGLNGHFLVDSAVLFGYIPCCPYHTLGTQELADSVTGCISDHDAMLLANHGVLVVGSDVESAYYLLEDAENLANITWHLKCANIKSIEFTHEEFDDLINVRKNRNMPGRHPGHKKDKFKGYR